MHVTSQQKQLTCIFVLPTAVYCMATCCAAKPGRPLILVDYTFVSALGLNVTWRSFSESVKNSKIFSP
jgi:hypothetical protein